MEYFVEAYFPSSRAAELEEQAGQIRAAVAKLADAVRYRRTIFVPEDETCFYVFEGDSQDDVGRVATEVGLTFIRVVDAVVAGIGLPDDRPPSHA